MTARESVAFAFLAVFMYVVLFPVFQVKSIQALFRSTGFCAILRKRPMGGRRIL